MKNDGEKERIENRLGDALEDFMAKVRAKNPVPQEIYVLEECSELVKEISKKLRSKGSDAEIKSEACDVIAALLVQLRELGMGWPEMLERVIYKYGRAIERVEKNEEF